jgi:hypothetical protein
MILPIALSALTKIEMIDYLLYIDSLNDYDIQQEEHESCKNFLYGRKNALREIKNWVERQE